MTFHQALGLWSSLASGPAGATWLASSQRTRGAWSRLESCFRETWAGTGWSEGGVIEDFLLMTRVVGDESKRTNGPILVRVCTWNWGYGASIWACPTAAAAG